jgi:HPt (histidine-containing phosphotransfer) domain-containing protein
MRDGDLARELEGLRRSYRDKLIELLARLGSLVREARKVRDGDGLRAARDLAHRLKGTSGSYGFDECSAQLRRIEERLERLADATPADAAPSDAAPADAAPADAAPADAAAIWMEIEQALSRARSGCS